MTVEDLIKRTRIYRGLPEKVEDSAVLARVARIVASAGKRDVR